MPSAFSKTLSSRLQLAFNQLLPHYDVWDLCCDHGYLGLKAHSAAGFGQIHFVDPAIHLIDDLRKRCGAASGISFYPICAQDVENSMTGNVVIAGVGAELIRQIVFELLRRQKLDAKRLILIPHTHANKMQVWLTENDSFARIFQLCEVLEVTENNRKREVFIYDRI